MRNYYRGIKDLLESAPEKGERIEDRKRGLLFLLRVLGRLVEYDLCCSEEIKMKCNGGLEYYRDLKDTLDFFYGETKQIDALMEKRIDLDGGVETILDLANKILKI